MFTFQRQLRFFPGHRAPQPANVEMAGVAVIDLATPDGETVQVWYTPALPNRQTVLYFQGDAGEIADRADRFA